MNTKYKCRVYFTSAKTKQRYSYGDVIEFAEYNQLYHNERNNFIDYNEEEKYTEFPVSTSVEETEVV